LKPVIIIAIVIVCSVAIFSILPNAEAKQTTKLTFGGLHSTYTIGETMKFQGELRDSENYAISGARIWVVEDDVVSNSLISSGLTNPRGEFEIKIPASRMDGSDNTLEFFLWYEGDYSFSSARTSIKTVTLQEPRTVYSEPVQDRTISSYRSTILSIDVMSGSFSNSFRVWPTLTDGAGNPINTELSVYSDGVYKGKSSFNTWSKSFSCNEGNSIIKVSINQFKFGVNIYAGNSASEYFNCKSTTPSYSATPSTSTYVDSDGDGIIDKYDDCIFQKETRNGYKDTDGCPDTKPINQSNEKQISIEQQRKLQSEAKSVQVESYKQLDKLRDGVSVTEEALKKVSANTPEQKETIDKAWDLLKINKKKLNQYEEQFQKGDRQFGAEYYESSKTWYKIKEKDSQNVEESLKEISKLIEKAHQKICFLFWCW